MKKICQFALLVLLFALSGRSTGFAGNITVVSAPEAVRKYEIFTLSIKLPFLEANPNDSDKVKLDVEVTAPGGKIASVPAFCLKNSKSESVSMWEARFTPREEGRYAYSVKLASDFLNEETSPNYFTASGQKGDGFLRRSLNNPHYLAFDSGEKFFGIGHNIAWAYEDSVAIYERYFSKLEKYGCNLTRVWLSSWSFPLEWRKVGRYSEKAARNLDKLMEAAEEKNIYIILCLDTYGSLMEEQGPWGEDNWRINPYNRKKGGPCENPKDFFIDPEARRWYKNKLRYIAARWGSSPNILAFELWNEYNAPEEWVKEMAGYIKSIDPHGHLVTTSFGYPWGEVYDKRAVWKLDEIDFISEHVYGNTSPDGLVLPLLQKAKYFSTSLKKPFIFAETGIDSANDDSIYDTGKKGIALHNSIWSTSLSKSFAGAMNWWWDSYLKDEKLYSHYRALADFLDGVDWNSENVGYLQTSHIMVKKKHGTDAIDETNKEIILKTNDAWGKTYVNEFIILNDGSIKGGGMPSKYLHGTYHKTMKKDQVYIVNYPVDGKFIAHIGMVSQGAHLRVFIDGKEALERTFPVGPGKGPWKRSLYLKKYDVYQCVYDEDISVEVPEGKHIIRLSNAGKDWLGIESITLTNYTKGNLAPARCMALAVGEEMLFWLQNNQSNWKNALKKIEPERIKNAYFYIFGVKNGTYRLEWWDTYKGEVFSRKKKEAKDGRLEVDIPGFFRDIACKMKMVE